MYIGPCLTSNDRDVMQMEGNLLIILAKNSKDDQIRSGKLHFLCSVFDWVSSTPLIEIQFT